MSDKKNQDLKIEAAPQEAIRFNQKLLDIFLWEIFKIKGAWVSDESYLNDFRPFCSFGKVLEIKDNGDRVIETTYYKNEDALKKYGKPLIQLNKEERKTLEKTKKELIPRKDMILDEDIIEKTKAVFGVDISSVIKDGNMVKIITYIAQNMPEPFRSKFISKK